MDIFQADIFFNSNKYQTLEDLKALNEKFAFIAKVQVENIKKSF